MNKDTGQLTSTEGREYKMAEAIEPTPYLAVSAQRLEQVTQRLEGLEKRLRSLTDRLVGSELEGSGPKPEGLPDLPNAVQALGWSIESTEVASVDLAAQVDRLCSVNLA